MDELELQEAYNDFLTDFRYLEDMLLDARTPQCRREKGEIRDWEPLANAAREAKGEWVTKQGDHPKAISTNINRGMIKAFRPEGAFEAYRVRDVVYVRYVGGSHAS